MLADDVADDLVDIVLDGVDSQCVREVLEYLVRDGQLQRACHLKEMLVPAVKAMRVAAVEVADDPADTPGEPLPLRPPPSEAMLLQQLCDATREFGRYSWTLFTSDADEVLQALYEREPGFLRRSVTKRWGTRWRARLDRVPQQGY